MRTRVRSVGLWKREGRVPEVPQQKVDASVVGVCGTGEEWSVGIATHRRVRELRRSAGTGVVRYAEYELGGVPTTCEIKTAGGAEDAGLLI